LIDLHGAQRAQEIIMYDHIGIKVGNLDASIRFYTAALAPLGFVLCSKDEDGAGFGPRASRRCGSICTRV
jgi:catechol 2,3-dioxygenase-like lactoylglutathione lyase family enzyme